MTAHGGGRGGRSATAAKKIRRAGKAIAGWALAALLCPSAGCIRSPGDILRKPVVEWSLPECRAVIASRIGHNINDKYARVRISATPFLPDVIWAINREQQLARSLSDEEFRRSVSADAGAYLGLSLEPATGAFLDPHGAPYTRMAQLDSLAFLVSIEDNNATGVINLPDITGIESRIFLENDHDRLLRPARIWRKGDAVLRHQQTLMVMFTLRTDLYDFLADSRNMVLLFKGFGIDIGLKFDLDTGD